MTPQQRDELIRLGMLPAVSSPTPGDYPDPLDAAATQLAPDPAIGRTVSVRGDDGEMYSVPAITDAVGRDRYRLGDVQAAQEQAASQRRAAAVREDNAVEASRYGTGSPQPTQEQLDARERRASGERSRLNNLRAIRQRTRKLADDLGVSEDVAYEAYMNAAASFSPSDGDVAGSLYDPTPVPGRGYGEGALVALDGTLTAAGIGEALAAARRAILADRENNGAVDRQAERRRNAPRIIQRREQLRRNPIEYLGRDDVNDWQRQVVARSMLARGGQTPLDADEGDKNKLGWAQLQAQIDQNARTLEQAGRHHEAAMARASNEHAERMAAIQADRDAARDAAAEAARRGDREAEDRARAHDAALAKMQSDLQLAMQQMQTQSQQFESRMEEDRKARDAQYAEAREDRESRERVATANTDVERTKVDAMLAGKKEEMQRTADQQEKLAERERLAPFISQYGPGVQHILDGNYGTPEAQESLGLIAADADRSWTGFYNSDALRMDATLQQMGVTDPNLRRQFIEEYGLGTQQAFGPGGRSGPISGLVNFFSGDPRYTTYGE